MNINTVPSINTNCGSRLPCGLCLITNQPCPFGTTNYDIVYCGDSDSTAKHPNLATTTTITAANQAQ